ncbi:MAG: imidazole glycerol phosphate synthase subunit HisF [Rhodospirillales bacterium]|nr:imidazole glycerol phosphate synthase subunit HisF [Rhodospirillales bacterium]
MTADKRIIACLFVREGRVVQSRGFRDYLPVGRPEIAARFLDSWGADAIALVDIDARREGRTIDPRMVERVAANIFAPLAAGGGLSSVAQMRDLLSAGADKLIVNRAFHDKPGLVTEGASHFGSQAMIASIDVRVHATDSYEVMLDRASLPTGFSPWEYAQRLEQAGAGEILLNAVDRDGSGTGYDIGLAACTAAATTLPIILLGGAGHPRHVAEALSAPGVSAAAAANFWHFTEHSVALTKAYCARAGVAVRRDASVRYGEFEFEADGRLAKIPDRALDERIFETLEEDAV